METWWRRIGHDELLYVYLLMVLDVPLVPDGTVVSQVLLGAECYFGAESGRKPTCGRGKLLFSSQRRSLDM